MELNELIKIYGQKARYDQSFFRYRNVFKVDNRLNKFFSNHVNNLTTWIREALKEHSTEELKRYEVSLKIIKSRLQSRLSLLDSNRVLIATIMGVAIGYYSGLKNYHQAISYGVILIFFGFLVFFIKSNFSQTISNLDELAELIKYEIDKRR